MPTMASTDPSPSAITQDSSPSTTAAAAAAALPSVSSENPRTSKQRILLRVKRLRHNRDDVKESSPAIVPSNHAPTDQGTKPSEEERGGSASTSGSNPAKKRKVDHAIAPEIIRLTLPSSNSSSSPKRHKSSEEMELISRLSSAVSLYGDETTIASTFAPSTPTREEEREIPSSKTPMKPKRSAVFRKLNDLRKLLHEDENDDEGRPSSSSSTHDREWDSKGEERSKWLRVVDVQLQESEAEAPTDDLQGVGPRLQKSRPRPSLDNEGDGGEGGGGRTKRRKLGLVVEKSCTMSKSEFFTNTTTASSDKKSLTIDTEISRLISASLQTLHNQRGGSVSPFLSFLKFDSRFDFVQGTSYAQQMINHKLVEGNGRTVLHYAALWGDVDGIQSALKMGADPTIVDALGHTPSALADMNAHETALMTLLEAESRTVKSYKEDDYYYEVYCLEEAEDSSSEILPRERVIAPSQVKVPNRNGATSPNASSFTTSESEAMDSPPDLIRMDGHRMSESEDDSCQVIELQNGFGYWNEKGELILETSAKQASSAASSVAYADDDVCDSSEDDTIDYPDEQSDEMQDGHSAGFDFGDLGSDYGDYLDSDARLHTLESDDDSDAGWKLDFRNRFVPRSNIEHDDSEGELSSGGFGTNRNRLHGWEYGGMSDGESDDYAGPMLG